MGTKATLFGAVMTLLTGNAGGAIQSLPGVNVNGGRERVSVETITLAAQASGSVIGVARIPVPFVLTGIGLLTDTSLGTTTIAIGDASGAATYMVAQTLTTVNQIVNPTAIVAAMFGAQINSGYDSVTGNAVSPQAPGQGGGSYADLQITTAVAALPGAGTLKIFFKYVID